MDSKIAMLQATLQDSIGKQTREFRRQLDKLEWHIFMNAPKGQGKFTGKIGAPVEQKGLEWKAPMGWVWILQESEEQSRHGGNGKS
jgi:hypothetical protein